MEEKKSHSLLAACRHSVAVHDGQSRASNMATSTGRDGKSLSISDVDVLLHPELLSQDFIQLILREVSQTFMGY